MKKQIRLQRWRPRERENLGLGKFYTKVGCVSIFKICGLDRNKYGELIGGSVGETPQGMSKFSALNRRYLRISKNTTLEVRIYLHPDLVSTFTDDLLEVIHDRSDI
jgi:hypothetical protein